MVLARMKMNFVRLALASLVVTGIGQVTSSAHAETAGNSTQPIDDQRLLTADKDQENWIHRK